MSNTVPPSFAICLAADHRRVVQFSLKHSLFKSTVQYRTVLKNSKYGYCSGGHHDEGRIIKIRVLVAL